MKLTAEDTQRLLNVITTCAVGGIESIVIEDGFVRGANPDKTFAIISDHEVPKFPQKIGISRINSLKSRIDLFSDNPNTVIEAKESERGEISSIEISAGRNKAQFRCTSTMLIKAPKSINDEEVHGIILNKAELKIVLNALKVMGAKTVQLIIKKEGNVTVGVADENNDLFSAALETPAQLKDGKEADSVVHYYHAPIFHSVVRTLSDAEVAGFIVGESGTLRTKINGHDVIVLPKINDSEEE
jgi:hypothetical protein